jgi:effector-binding domain-containing protein
MSKPHSTDMHVVQTVPRRALVVRRNVTTSEISKTQREARPILSDALKKSNIASAGRPLTVWRPAQDGKMEYAPGVLVSESVKLEGEASLFTLPRGRAAHLRLIGSYEGLPQAWQSLFDGCKAKGLELAGLNWEVYPEPGTPPETCETDLYALLT